MFDDQMTKQRTPLDECLSLWADWMRRQSVFKDDTHLSQIFGMSNRTFDDMCDAIDIAACEAVDAMIDSLSTQHQWAIYKRCGMASVWRYDRLNFVETLTSAEIELEKKLRKNNALTQFFV